MHQFGSTLARAARFVLALALLLACVLSHAAAPAAGFVIKNRAEATYVPAGRTLPETIGSNVVTATVDPVEKLSLQRDLSVSLPDGALAVLPHVLTNTGNVVSTYAFQVENLSGDGFDLASLHLVLDVDGNGLPDSGEPRLPPGQPTLVLSPGQSANILVVGVVPIGVGNLTSQVRLAASTLGASKVSATNVDTVTSGRRAALRVFKSTDQAGTVRPGATVGFEVVATNVGDSPAVPAGAAAPMGTPIRVNGEPVAVFLLRDEVPAGMAYVPGSLSTSIPSATYLFRLPGDAPFSYRTNGDDASAIEVAVASRAFSLTPNMTTSMRFSAVVQGGPSSSVTNIADAYFHDGVAPAQMRSNPVQLPIAQDRIGLAKRAALPVYEFDPVTQRPLGTARVRMHFVLQNFGSAPLAGVQVSDRLEGADRFGTYTSASTPGRGQYTVVPDSWRVLPLRSGASVQPNVRYTGSGASDGLLGEGAGLPPMGAVEVSFELRVNVLGVDRAIYNTARMTAQYASGAGPVLADDSVDGSEPDLNGDGDPTNDASPTPVLLSLPTLAVVKTSTEPRRIGPSTWESDMSIAVTNTGKTIASYVQVGDNLDCAFRLGGTQPGAVTDVQVVAGPVALQGLLAPNSGYTGRGACMASQQADGNPYLAMPSDAALLLTDGKRHLEPGASDTLRFTVRFTVDERASAQQRVFTNRAYAAASDRSTPDGRRLVAAAESDTRMVAVDPSGVIYNAVTRQPVAGAEVRLVRLACDAARSPITAEQLLAVGDYQYSYLADGSVSLKTGANGAYAFYFKSPPVDASCEYGLTVAPPPGSELTWPSNLLPPASGAAPGGRVQLQSTAPATGQPTPHYLLMRLGPTLPEVLNNHIPLDPIPRAGTLLLEKKANRSIIELGGSVEYTLTLKNISGKKLTGYSITDRLPLGFRYQEGTARLDGKRVADPARAAGGVLQFDLPALTLDNAQSVEIAYRVNSSMATPLGEAVNRAQAFSGDRSSNIAERKVRVDGGVFSNEAYLIGKVFLDCNGNGIQDEAEVGIPGVRLLLEDGTGVVTDVEGKYSLYGLRAITHVLKLDRTTLPPGAEPLLSSSRQSGVADSRFVDLKNGELHKADFAIGSCDVPAVRAEVQRRRKALAERPDGEGIAVSKTRLDLQPPTALPVDQVRRRDAVGELTPSGISRGAVAASGAPAPAAAVFQPVMPADLPAAAVADPLARAVQPRVELESLLPGVEDASLAFLDLKDGDTLPMAQLHVRVKGHAESTLQLAVNGRVEGLNRVGKRARMPERQLEAWEYIGVELRPGENVLKLQEIDPFGVARGTVEIRVTAPGQPAKLHVQVPETSVADGATPVRVRVRLTDERNVPVTARTQLTLEADNGRWETRDLNPVEPGTQVFMEGGEAQFLLLPPSQPGDAVVRVSAGSIVAQGRVAFLPELRPLIGAGVLEGVLDLRRKGLLPIGQPAGNPFEQTLRNLSRESADGRVSLAGRAAFYFKGAVRGEYLLTAAYDTDKATRERLFRDIQPDKFYPIYGDSSSKLFDAQSTERLYLRIDKQKSWLLFGDFTTAQDMDVRKLSAYSRAATGVKAHYETGDVTADVFARRDSLAQVVVEIAANGTSGPYQLPGSAPMVEGSERVEILVRDRRQPQVILQTIAASRFADYAVEPLGRRIRFTSPVASLDENLNPRSIRVTYESDTGGPAFWAAGA